MPITFIFILLSLLAQAVFLSSTTMTTSPGSGPDRTVQSFGFGSPIKITKVNGQTTLRIQLGVLSLNLIGTYVLAAILAAAIAKATRLRLPATAYGLVALAMIAVAFLVSIGISKVYWGYFIAEPALLSDVSEIAEVRAIASVKIADDSGERTFVADDSHSLADQLASAKKYPDDCLDGRMLLELERRNLIPTAFTGTPRGLPELYQLVQESGTLEPSSPGYDSAGQLQGVVVDAMGSSGNRLVFVCLTGGQLSNDHYPYYELLFRGRPDAAQLNFVRSQRFFYDAAGMEGFEWYVIWPLLAIPGIFIGFLLFTAVKTLPMIGALANSD